MMPPATSKTVLAVVLETMPAMLVTARYANQCLEFKGAERIAGKSETWLPEIRQLVEECIAKDWVVVIDDRTQSFSDKAMLWNFDRLNEDGRTAMQECLDWYFALQARGALIFPESMNAYIIRSQVEGAMIDFANDDKGRMVYKVDWRKFQSAHRGIMMCIAGAFMEEPMSDRWLNAFFSKETYPEPSPLTKFLRHVDAITTQQTMRLGEDFEARIREREAQKEGKSACRT